MKESKAEATRWLQQAENDLLFAELGLRNQFHAQVCFQSQQICEKAVKAIRYCNGERFVYGHSLVEPTSPLEELAELRDDFAILDQCYIPTRYPNGLPGGVPYETYTSKQAAEAVRIARRVVGLAHRRIGGGLPGKR